jgi:hypothetical protein
LVVPKKLKKKNPTYSFGDTGYLYTISVTSGLQFNSNPDVTEIVFFTQNHPLYRKLILYMDIDCILMPNFMQAQIDSLVGIKAAGKGCETDDIGENFDFLVEYINNKNGQPLSGAKQFRRDQFFTSGDYLFLLLFSKQSRRNQFSK